MKLRPLTCRWPLPAAMKPASGLSSLAHGVSRRTHRPALQQGYRLDGGGGDGEMRSQAIAGSDDRRGRGDDDSVQRKSMLQWKTINYDMADALH